MRPGGYFWFWISFVLLVLLFNRTYAAYEWKQVADRRGYVAEQAALYLFSPTDITSDGKHLRRADLIDGLLKQAIEK